jgi:hypothetical protein
VSDEKRFQLRGVENGVDTGELHLAETLEEAFEMLLQGGWWKLSWTRPDGERVRLVKTGNTIAITDLMDETEQAIANLSEDEEEDEESKEYLKSKEYLDAQAIDKRVEDAVVASGQKIYVEYSAYKTDEDDCPIDNLDEIAAHGDIVLVSGFDPSWGDGASYRSEVLHNPTWLHICVHANQMIETTGDHHHAYLEGITKRNSENGLDIYEFEMGS